MALVIISGLPCAGRSTVAAALQADFEARLASSSSSSAQVVKRIAIVSDRTVHTPKTAYSAQVLEKPARASYLSAVSRALGTDVVVLADGGAGLNIKGFRYQLWCEAREQGVRCVTLHVFASPEECKRRNTARREAGEEAYDDETIEDMLKRFEEPNAMTRWDSPLFLVKSDPPIPEGSEVPSTPTQVAAEVDGEGRIPYDEIWKAATEAAPRKAPAVVVPHRQTTTNYLSALETVTQTIITHLLSSIYQSTGSTSIPIPLPSQANSQSSSQGPNGASAPQSAPSPNANANANASPSLTLKLSPSALERPPTLSSLQRLRRQFVKMHSTGLASGSEIANAKAAVMEARSVGRGGGVESRDGRLGNGDGRGVGLQQSGGTVGGQAGSAKAAASTTEDDIARSFVGWLQQTL